MKNFKKSSDELKFQGRRKRGGDDVDGNYKRRQIQTKHLVTINHYITDQLTEARANKKRPTIVDPRQQCCAMSNSTSV